MVRDFGLLNSSNLFSDLGSMLGEWEISFKSTSKGPRHAMSQDEFHRFESLVKAGLSNAVSLLQRLYSPSDRDIHSSMAPKLFEKNYCIRADYDGPLEKYRDLRIWISLSGPSSIFHTVKHWRNSHYSTDTN